MFANIKNCLVFGVGQYFVMVFDDVCHCLTILKTVWCLMFVNALCCNVSMFADVSQYFMMMFVNV